jgi:hypothetical protein
MRSKKQEPTVEQAPVEDFANFFLNKASSAASHPIPFFDFNHYFMLNMLVH